VRVLLTAQGRALESPAAAARARVEAATCLSQEEFTQLRSLLHRLRTNVAAAQTRLW